MNDTEAMSYLAEIIDAARAGGAPREYIQALQMAREALDADTGLTPEEVSKMQKDLAQTRQDLRMALDTAKANAQLLTRAKKCITDCETYLILGDGRYAARTIADWRKNQNEHLRIRRDL